jgi:hypothetical protein
MWREVDKTGKGELHFEIYKITYSVLFINILKNGNDEMQISGSLPC